jgi:hypothetical protein
LANFVGIVVGFLSICKERSRPFLTRILLAASLSFEIEMVSVKEKGDQNEKQVNGSY